MMGDGVVIMPKEPYVYAPTEGTVTFVFDTKHAIGFETDSGISLLIHVGIDTVKLNGVGFTVVVENGQRVKSRRSSDGAGSCLPEGACDVCCDTGRLHRAYGKSAYPIADTSVSKGGRSVIRCRNEIKAAMPVP